MRRLVKVAGSLLLSLALVAACGGTSETPDDDSTSGGIPDEFKNMVLVGSSQGGSGYNYMVAVSQLFNKYLGMNTSVQAGGTQENALLVGSGDLQFAITSPGDLISASNDPNAMQGTSLRTIFNIFNVSWLILVPEDSTATSLADLKGQRIAIGTPGGGEYPLFHMAIECLGLTEDDFQPQAIGKAEAMAAYQDGNVDAWQAQGPNPSGQFIEVIESRRGAKVIGAGEDVLDCLVETSDEFVRSEIPANTYPGQTVAIPTVDEWFYAVATEDLPESVAYQMAKVLDEHYDELVASYPGAATSTAANTATAVGFPLHPGTERYLKEIGLLDS